MCVSNERVTRIELALSAWEAEVLPLNYTRIGALRIHAANSLSRRVFDCINVLGR
jgi:hypothetical protein